MCLLYYSVLWQIPEYCKNVEEAEIISQSFPLIFAFDEIIALGYRENVNLAQIRTFTEMDSHEEKVFQAIRQVAYLSTIVCLELLWIRAVSVTLNYASHYRTIVQ